MKPGWKTSEFCLSFLAMLLTAFYSSGLVVPPKIAGVIGFAAATLTALGYSVGRSMVKAADAKKLPPTSPATVVVNQPEVKP